MTKAYLNALYEEGTRKELFEWVCKLDKENDQLRDDKRRLDTENALLRKELHTLDPDNETPTDAQMRLSESWTNREGL
jgi:predicted nuclease with TOPRIM domain